MSEQYFGPEVDQAISDFLKDTNQARRSKIFEKKIMPAFTKLSQYHYNKIPVSRNMEIIQDCVVFLYEQMHKFNPDISKRGFPYFNMIAKHYYIQKLKAEKKEVLNDQEMILSLNDSNVMENDSLVVDDLEKDIENDEFVKLFKEKLHIWKDRFSKKSEKDIIDALTVLINDSENIELYNKKAILLYLKEISGLNSKQVVINLNKIKKKFILFKKKYERGDI